jgi:hypothetical protein
VALDEVADRQVVLSRTAGALGRRLAVARLSTLILLIVDAAAAAWAAALGKEFVGYVWFTTVGAGCLALAAIVSSSFLGGEARRRHVPLRAASEALKREAFLYATRSGSYGAPDRDQQLLSKLESVDNDVAVRAKWEVQGNALGRCPRTLLKLNDYLETRINTQIISYGATARRLARLRAATGSNAKVAAAADQAEAIIADETGSWRAMFLSDQQKTGV